MERVETSLPHAHTSAQYCSLSLTIGEEVFPFIEAREIKATTIKGTTYDLNEGL